MWLSLNSLYNCILIVFMYNLDFLIVSFASNFSKVTISYSYSLILAPPFPFNVINLKGNEPNNPVPCLWTGNPSGAGCLKPPKVWNWPSDSFRSQSSCPVRYLHAIKTDRVASPVSLRPAEKSVTHLDVSNSFSITERSSKLKGTWFFVGDGKSLVEKVTE